MISVTQEDINRGQTGESAICPIAHAVRRAFKTYKKAVAVFPDGAYVGAWSAALPMKALHFMDKFDNNGKVKPFKMQLKFDKY